MSERLYGLPSVLGAGLVAAYLAAVWIESADSHGLVGAQFMDLFHPDREKSIGAWYQSMLLVGCAALVYYAGERIPGHGERFRLGWRLLACGLLFMSMDEAAVIHERLAILVPAAWHEGVLKYAWVLPAMLVLAAIVPFYVRFVIALPRVLRTRLLVAAGVYLGGALGLEMFGGFAMDAWATEHKRWIVVAEEAAELAGLLLALRALVCLLIDLTPPGRVLQRRGVRPRRTTVPMLEPARRPT
ncbi:MAG: hypothetical protein DCC71_17640 [Proteobacteria bacterium]|nr:MAG: hypothetical protein DCC71_17640 [Pseudomonadota bacterium]